MASLSDGSIIAQTIIVYAIDAYTTKHSLFFQNLLQLSSELCASNEMVSLCIEYVSPGPSEADEATNTIDGDEMRPTTIAEADRVEKMVTWFKR